MTQNAQGGVNYAVNDEDIFDQPEKLPVVIPRLLDNGMTIVRAAWNHNSVTTHWERTRDQIRLVHDMGMKIQLVFGADESDGLRGDISDNGLYFNHWQMIDQHLSDFIHSYELLNEPHAVVGPKDYTRWSGTGGWGDAAAWYTWKMRQFTDKKIIVPLARSQSAADGFEPSQWQGWGAGDIEFAAHTYAYWFTNGQHNEKLIWTEQQWINYWNDRWAALLASGYPVQVNEYGIGRKDIPDDDGDWSEYTGSGLYLGDFMVRWMRYFHAWVRQAPTVTTLINFHATPAIDNPTQMNRTYSFINPDGTIYEPQMNLYLYGEMSRSEDMTIEQRVTRIEQHLGLV